LAAGLHGSLIHYNIQNPNWVLPDRNTIPHDVPFFQSLRELLPSSATSTMLSPSAA